MPALPSGSVTIGYRAHPHDGESVDICALCGEELGTHYTSMTPIRDTVDGEPTNSYVFACYHCGRQVEVPIYVRIKDVC